MEEIRDQFKVDVEDFQKIPGMRPIRDIGNCGDVYFVTQKSTGKRCVLKQTKKKVITKEKSQDQIVFYQEVDAFILFKHPAIVNFIGWQTQNKKGNIYLELMENGSLTEYIEKHKGQMTVTQKIIISYGVARAMKYLHSYNLLHRDLKADNILLDKDLHPYVTDFGTSKRAEDVRTSLTVQQTTVIIMPPEFIEDYKAYNRTKPIDVYSYSMVLFYLWYEQPPFPKNLTSAVIVDYVMKGKRPEIPSNNSPNENLNSLIERCWDQNPAQRLTFSEICELFESDYFDSLNHDKTSFKSYKEFIDSTPETKPDIIPQSIEDSIAKSS